MGTVDTRPPTPLPSRPQPYLPYRPPPPPAARNLGTTLPGPVVPIWEVDLFDIYLQDHGRDTVVDLTRKQQLEPPAIPQAKPDMMRAKPIQTTKWGTACAQCAAAKAKCSRQSGSQGSRCDR